MKIKMESYFKEKIQLPHQERRIVDEGASRQVQQKFIGVSILSRTKLARAFVIVRHKSYSWMGRNLMSPYQSEQLSFSH